MDSVSPSPEERKRKRDDPAAEELEINVDAPEPPSKKALRRAKKGKPPQERRSSTSPPPHRRDATGNGHINGGSDSPGKDTETKDRKSEHGVWIGNLPWQADKAALRTFLTERGGLADDDITRIHMPAPSKHAEPSGPGVRAKPHNKGFAYVDFVSQEAQQQAIDMSETLLNGRALLIKDAHSFVGRPAEHKAAPADSRKTMMEPQSHPPNKRIFVGNMSFDTDRQMVREHFENCGDVEQVFLATFEDTGRCKGYGWITFGDIESAERAVKGLVLYERMKANTKGRLSRPGRYDALLLGGQKLRAEFAEDATVRYEKRFGKHSEQNREAE